ncbi:Hin recombinase, partial [Escherichia coli]|nr:Hin recombinase [Escherichia coli]
GRKGGRPPAIDAEKVDQILAALEGGASKASVCRAFSVPRSTLTDTLRRIGWAGPGGRNLTTDQSNVISRR